ncbi:hypothetical protein TALC_00282 [Thermoplasmatales archaeon BRNA1]|nr:hypothetical protein TALC_00282 [Thermoplasmatales archaeon BRNA1]
MNLATAAVLAVVILVLGFAAWYTLRSARSHDCASCRNKSCQNPINCSIRDDDDE